MGAQAHHVELCARIYQEADCRFREPYERWPPFLVPCSRDRSAVDRHFRRLVARVRLITSIPLSGQPASWIPTFTVSKAHWDQLMLTPLRATRDQLISSYDLLPLPIELSSIVHSYGCEDNHQCFRASLMTLYGRPRYPAWDERKQSQWMAWNLQGIAFRPDERDGVGKAGAGVKRYMHTDSIERDVNQEITRMKVEICHDPAIKRRYAVQLSYAPSNWRRCQRCANCCLATRALPVPLTRALPVWGLAQKSQER